MHQNTKSPRSPKLDRRAELLKVSREIMAEKGYEATTVSAIVARAGVAQGTFYWYFPSKASIVKALTVEMQDEVQAALTSAFMVSESLDRKIERSIRDIFGILSHYHDVLVLSRLIDSASGNEFVFAPYHRLIAELLHHEQERGTITGSIDPEIAAELIVGTVYYANLQCYVYHSTQPVEKYIAGTSQFVRQALGLT